MYQLTKVGLDHGLSSTTHSWTPDTDTGDIVQRRFTVALMGTMTRGTRKYSREGQDGGAAKEEQEGLLHQP